jgi:tetratricopeptide (TPR) repeat protein
VEAEMKTSTRVFVVGVMLAAGAGLFAPPSVAFEAITKVRGTVTDNQGKPMPKVSVYFEASDIKKKVGPVKTNKDGRYIIATLDKSVAKKWKVYPDIPGYKVVKLVFEIFDSEGLEVEKGDHIPGSKQEFRDFQLVLVGDVGRNQIDFVVAKEADFLAAVQAERQKREAGTAAAGQQPAQPAAAATPAAPAVSAGAESLRQAKQLADAGRHPEAVEAYRAFLAKDPTGNPAVYYYLGKSLYEMRDDPGAEAAFRKGLEIKPDMKGAHFFLGNLYLRQAEDPIEAEAAATRAVAEYQQEVKLSPDNDSVAYNLGLACIKAGQDDQALTALERAATLNPTKGEAYLKMATIYEKRKDHVRAQEMYQKFSAADPANAAVSLYNIGVIAWNENRAKDAVQYYRKAVELDPQYAVAHRELARALMSSQDFTGALKHFQEYLRISPKAPDAREIQDNIALLKK